MITVSILYHVSTHRMEITSISTEDNTQNDAVATSGDTDTTQLVFTFDDPNNELDGWTKRAEFNVNVPRDYDASQTYKPYITINADNTITLPKSILKAVKCGILPMQLAFTRYFSYGQKTEYYSLNILKLAVNPIVGAVEEINKPLYPTFADAVTGVDYSSENATFTFTQADGTVIVISLSDLSEEHYTVDTYDGLATLSQAQNGDTATVLDTGAWYKLYGSYAVLGNWHRMSGGVTINGSASAYPVFYAPVSSGTASQILISNGEKQSPEYRTLSAVFTLDFTSMTNQGADLTEYNFSANSAVIIQFMDKDGNNVYLPYSLNTDTEKYTSISVDSSISETITVKIIAIPTGA